MLDQNLRKSTGLNLFQMTVAAFLGLILGIACVKFSGFLILGIMLAGLFLYAILKRPELALLGILISTSSIVFEDQLPMFSAGGISLHIPDFLLLGMLALIIVRWLVEPNFKLVRTPLDWPLLIFIAVTLLSTFISLYQSSVPAEEARRWIRVLFYYLTFFIVTNLVRDRRQLNLLLNGIFMLATVVAAVMLAQYLLGSSVTLLPGRVESLNTQGVDYAEITRILPPGLSIVLVAFITTFCILLQEKDQPFVRLKIFQSGLLGMALIFTFLRSYWAALMMVMVLLLFIIKGYERQKLLNWGIVLVFLASIFLLIISNIPDSNAAGLLGASRERLNTVFEVETYQGRDASFSWRVVENGYALETIAANPWIGLGMGFSYRPWDRRLDGPAVSSAGYDFRKHIHNGHFWILLQSGLIGYLAFLWLSFTFVIRGLKHWRNIANDRLGGVVLGLTLAYLAIFIAAALNSTFMMWQWTPVLGIIFGINELILHWQDPAQPAA